MGRGPSEYFDYEQELMKSIGKKEQQRMSRNRIDEFEDDDLDEILNRYNFSAGASREIKKSLIHEPKKGNQRKVNDPNDIQEGLGITDGVPATEHNKSSEYYDEEDKDGDWKRARKAQARAEAKKGAETEDTSERYGTAEKSFSLTGDFRKDKRGLREILEKAAWGQKERAAERLAELDLVKSESGLRYLANMLDADWFE